MKAKKIHLTNVRTAFKSINDGSMFTIIKKVYAVLGDRKDWADDLKKVLPASKKQALDEAQKIIDWGRVGQKRIVKKTVKGCQTEIEVTIKASADMVLRYYVAKYNDTLTK